MTVFGTAGFLSTFGGAIMTKLDEFIEKAKRVHCGEDLDYSRAVYVNNRTPLCIIDHDLMDDGKTEYGEYWQTPYNHLRGQSHPLKRKNKISRNKSSKQEDVIRRFPNCIIVEEVYDSYIKQIITELFRAVISLFERLANHGK